MTVTIENIENYNSIYNIDFGEKVVFLKFGADWCVPCIELEKILECIPNTLVFNICIDNDNFESFFIDNNIFSIPDTIVKYKDSTSRFQGLKTEAEINKIIDDIKKTC